MKKILLITINLILVLTLIGCKKYVTVIFETNGGSYIETSKISESSNFDVSHVPEKDGYHFLGWYIDENYNTKYQSKIHNKESELTLFAKWEKSETTLKSDDFINLYIEAYKYHLEQKNFVVTAKGRAEANLATQEIESIKAKIEDEVYHYTASYSTFVKTAMQFSLKEDQYVIEKGSSNKDLTPKSFSKKTQSSLENFKEIYGISPIELNYIINIDTVLKVQNAKVDENGYQFILILDNLKSVTNYLKNIKATNVYESKNIVFKNIKLQVFLDTKKRLKEITYNENYEIEVDAPIIGWTKQEINSNINEKFNYDDEVIIKKY